MKTLIKNYSLANHAGLDTVNQKYLNRYVHPMKQIDYFFKLAGLVCGPIIISDTMLLDNYPLQKWIMASDNGLKEYLSPNSSDLIPGIVISARQKGSYYNILEKILDKRRMLFSSQNLKFDTWLLQEENFNMKKFYNNDSIIRSKPSEKWWIEYIETIDLLFSSNSNTRIDYPYGGTAFPTKLSEMLMQSSELIIKDDPNGWDFIQKEISNELEFDRSIAIRGLIKIDANNYHNSKIYKWINNAYRENLVTAMKSTNGKIIDSFEGSYPTSIIPKTVAVSIEKIMNQDANKLKGIKKIFLDKLTWEDLSYIRKQSTFKESLRELISVQQGNKTSQKRTELAIRNHFKTLTKICQNSSSIRGRVLSDSSDLKPWLKITHGVGIGMEMILIAALNSKGWSDFDFVMSGVSASVGGLIIIQQSGAKPRIKRALRYTEATIRRSYRELIKPKE